MARTDSSVRFFHGVFVRIRQVGTDDKYRVLRALVAPKLWLAQQTRECRIFPPTTIPDVSDWGHHPDFRPVITAGFKGDKPVLDPAFKGWPSYMIDAPATAARVMGTLAFVFDVPGELYFDTVYMDDTKQDPWSDQWAFGGNGDGTHA